MFQRRKEQANVEQLSSKSSSSLTPSSPPRTADKQPRHDSRRQVQRQLSPPRDSKPSVQLPHAKATIALNELTWKEAHRRTCLEHQKLAASFDQVTERFSSFRQFPRHRDEFVIWETGASLVAAATVNRQLNETVKPVTKLESKPERPSSWTRRILSTLSIGADDDNDTLSELGDDDGENKGESASDVVVEPNELIVNVELANACLQELKLALCDEPTPQVLLRNSSEGNIQPDVAQQFSFDAWCQQVATKCKNHDAQVVLANVEDPSMRDFLGALLVVNKLATFAPNRDDRIILGNTSAMPAKDIGTMVTLFDLQVNEESMKKNVENWSARADACGRSALEARRKGRTRQAAMDLQRRKTILQQIETTRNSLLQIEQIRNTVEHAQNQTEAVDCLQSSVDALKNMRADSTALQSLHLDIADNKAALEQSALHSSYLGTSEEDEALLQGLVDDIDEEQLLQELNQLQVSPAAAKRAGKTDLVGVTTGMSTTLTTSTKPPHALLDATIGIALSKPAGRSQPSPTKANGVRTPKNKTDDPDIRELERRLEALRVPVSSNKKIASDKKSANKPLATAALF